MACLRSALDDGFIAGGDHQQPELDDVRQRLT
jgi:hypothetical protein